MAVRPSPAGRIPPGRFRRGGSMSRRLWLRRRRAVRRVRSGVRCGGWSNVRWWWRRARSCPTGSRRRSCGSPGRRGRWSRRGYVPPPMRWRARWSSVRPVRCCHDRYAMFARLVSPADCGGFPARWMVCSSRRPVRRSMPVPSREVCVGAPVRRPGRSGSSRWCGPSGRCARPSEGNVRRLSVSLRFGERSRLGPRRRQKGVPPSRLASRSPPMGPSSGHGSWMPRRVRSWRGLRCVPSVVWMEERPLVVRSFPQRVLGVRGGKGSASSLRLLLGGVPRWGWTRCFRRARRIRKGFGVRSAERRVPTCRSRSMRSFGRRGWTAPRPSNVRCCGAVRGPDAGWRRSSACSLRRCQMRISFPKIGVCGVLLPGHGERVVVPRRERRERRRVRNARRTDSSVRSPVRSGPTRSCG